MCNKKKNDDKNKTLTPSKCFLIYQLKDLIFISKMI